jgi:hypothetical protein
MDTMTNLRTWNDRQAMADNLDSQGRRRNSDRTTMADLARPLREVAREQAALLRSVGSTGTRTAARADMQARVDRVRAAQAAPAPVARPAVASVTRPTYREADALAVRVPVGMYCLPRTRPSTNGNMVTFFKVHKFRGGHRIVQLVGSTGNYTELPLPVPAQVAALGHILKNVAAAASLYGREAKECGFCAANGRRSVLTNDRSRAVGYGQTCANNLGLPW